MLPALMDIQTTACALHSKMLVKNEWRPASKVPLTLILRFKPKFEHMDNMYTKFTVTDGVTYCHVFI